MPTESGVVIGRSSTADIRLDHPSVSRRHAIVLLSNGGVVVRDLESRQGVRVNGARVKEESLRDGDRVEIGPIAFTLEQGCLRPALPREGVRLDVRDLIVSRGQKRVLGGITLTIAPGQFVGILGASGSGKSTLLKCLAGQIEPNGGHRLFNDFDLGVEENRESYRSVVGYVPQDDKEDVVFGNLTGRELLDFALRLRSDEIAAERRETIARTLDRLQMIEHADRPIKFLSGGQKKRISVGLDLLFQPRLLFLDEPTSGLDPAQETRLMRLLRSLASQGTTVVCTTHVMENLELFDQVVVIAGGAVVFQGSPAELHSRFRVASYPELYESLEAQILEAEQCPGGDQPLANYPRAVKRRAPMPPIRTSAQILVQAQRGLRSIARDRTFLFMLIAQPVLIGLLINLSQLRPNGVEGIFTFGVVASIWLGLNNTAREVVRDRPVYARERSVGAVTAEGYLAAKTVLFGMIGLGQVLLLILVIRQLHFLGSGDAQMLEKAASWGRLIVVFWSTYCISMLLGLVISALASSEEVAVAALPLIILPQLLLTNASTGLKAADGYLGSLVLLIHGPASRNAWEWLLEGASLLTYSRPAVALLSKVPASGDFQVWIMPVNWLHLGGLLVVTAMGMLIAFNARERRWME